MDGVSSETIDFSPYLSPSTDVSFSPSLILLRLLLLLWCVPYRRRWNTPTRRTHLDRPPERLFCLVVVVVVVVVVTAAAAAW